MLDFETITYISDQSELNSILESLDAETHLAIDTEADSLHHYFEKVCLIQVSTRKADYIIDPLAGLDLVKFFEILSTKVLIIQGADYDLRMLRRDYNFSAHSIFDTMLAAQLLGYERFSYAALVERHVGVVLDKHGQKADWSQRPLPESLITYAAADTHYLFTVMDKLEEELIAKDRLHWLNECATKLLDYVSEGIRQPDPEKQWRIKGWHTLKPGRGWAYLRELWLWRDMEAQHVDFPPFKVMRNDLLIEIAKWAQNGFPQSETPNFPRNIYGRRRRGMERALEHARSMKPDEWPKPLETNRREIKTPDENCILELKKMREVHSARLELDPGVLLSTANISVLATSGAKTVEELRHLGILHKWQVDEMGSDIVKVVAGC